MSDKNFKQSARSLEDSIFYALAADLNKLTAQYQLPRGTPGAILHHQYADQYDKILERYGVTKSVLNEEITRRAKHR